MVVIHDFASLLNRLVPAFIFLGTLLGIISISYGIFCLYEYIYNKVSEELDNCNYFGEN